ncbi:hypothetical protein Dfri01_39440 [Dyadobacter frigoris]|uniref:helix-turn-helix domain-containing protein n=1 Tax=Dyadobacter frigoris TaxID=2576211 RepID=UPI0024A3FE5B|nr:helix-turn-helix transcriptional regulator [Dyadobacter frigoris]GLU54483.1 hypothetical protein Dfri01_39440 [Dyadobacter frigoris]
MTTGERVSRVLEDLNLSNLAFAQRLGVSSTVINGIVKDTNNPGHKVLTAFKREFPQYNIDWVLNGIGEMKNPVTAMGTDYLQVYLVRLEEQFKALRDQLAVKDSQMQTKDHQIENLQEMLKMAMGKLRPAAYLSKVITFRPEAPQAVA